MGISCNNLPLLSLDVFYPFNICHICLVNYECFQFGQFKILTFVKELNSKKSIQTLNLYSLFEFSSSKNQKLIFMVFSSLTSIWIRAVGKVIRSNLIGISSLPHNHDFKQPCMRSLLKSLREMEKMLVASIFSFSHNVFYPSQNKF